MTGVRDLGLPQGNPLALPRREAAAAGAVSSGKYDLIFRGGAGRPSTPSSPSSVSHIILMNGRGCFFTQQSTTIYRTTFDYSSAGITNLTTVSGTSSTVPFTLPTLGASGDILVLQGRYLWSHPVSPTQTLFHYAGSSGAEGGLFLVTWDGTGGPTVTTATLPSGFAKSGFGKWGHDAFILEDGNVGILAGSSTTGQLSLHVYTPTLTFVRTLNIINVGTVLAQQSAKIRKTSYGYIVAIYPTTSIGGNFTTVVATLNKDCTAVIATNSSGGITGVASQVNTMCGVILGEEGAIFTGVVGSNGIVSSVVFPVSSSGVISNSNGSSNANNNAYMASTGARPTLIDEIFQGSCCSKYADRNSPYAFRADSRDPAGSGSGGGYSYSPNFSEVRTGYSDMIVTPFISRYADPTSGTNWTAQVETDVKSVRSLASSGGYPATLSAEDPERGFVLLSPSQAGYSMSLFEKVYR